jgi:hypothetical protein
VRIASGLVPQRAVLLTIDGREITAGNALFEGSPLEWTATLSNLDRPGTVASLYFADGLRYVVVRLADGRSARARLAGTSFVAAAQRVCSLDGIERLT